MTDALHFTADPEANALLARDPMALLVGFALDQQVPVPKAFAGPLELQRRVGTIDARELAAMEPARLEQVFAEKPAIHRFPGMMARRVHELAAAIAAEWDGDASRVWEGVTDARELYDRLLTLPGIGEMKAKSLVAILGKRFGLPLAGIEDVIPKHPTLGDVDSAEALEQYQSWKREYKAKQRAER
jgi:uncharacterized HhH-GPD family protein